jgi:hypothetical protein
VNTFEPEVLDNPELLLSNDRAGLLRALASAGAQVRRSSELAGESGLDRLRGDMAPRAVLVATDSGAPYLSNLIGALARQSAPVLDWRDPVLPPWAGPADALLVASQDGRDPRLAELVAQADRRGLVIAAAVPAGSPVAAAAARHSIADVGYLAAVASRAGWWGLAAPMLLAIDALGLAEVRAQLSTLADALDEVAEANRPDSSAFTGRAKLLAADLADSVPVIAGAGPLARIAARRIAGVIQLIGGSTAMAAALPEDLARVGALLEFAAADSGFFADRVSETPMRPQLVLVGDDDPFRDESGFVGLSSSGPYPAGGLGPDRYGSAGQVRLDPEPDAARRAGLALASLASSRGIGCSRVLVPEAPSLVRFAAASATGDFAATYLALARGIDPSAPRLGELPN